MIQFTRRDQSDDSVETLTLVRLDGDNFLALQIETGTPESWKRDPNDRNFVGMYDLDGDPIQVDETWEIEEAPKFTGREALSLAQQFDVTLRMHNSPIDDARAISAAEAEDILASDPLLVYVEASSLCDALMTAWESGTSVCERVAEQTNS